LKQLKNIFFYCIVSILLLCAVLFYRQSFLAALFFMMLLLPILSILVCKYAFQKLEVNITSSTTEAEKNLPVSLTIHLNNPTVIPLLHVECTLRISSPFYGTKEAVTYCLPATSKEKFCFELPATYHYCGLYEAAVTEVKAYDYLQFVGFTAPNTSHTQTAIFPDSQKEVSYHPSLYTEGFDEYEASSLKGNISSNVTDIREYHPGDRLQQIHWKLSAKIDKLMVKENEATSSHQFYILLELYKPKGHPEYLDSAVEYAYGLSKELLFHKENFFFGFYSVLRGDFLSFPIRCESDITNALLEAYYEPSYQDPDLGRSFYENSGMQKGTLLQVTNEGVIDENPA